MTDSATPTPRTKACWDAWQCYKASGGEYEGANPWALAKKLEEELEQAKEENKRQAEVLRQGAHHQQAVDGENKRLREALEVIAICDDGDSNITPLEQEQTIRRVVEIAEQALKGQGGAS